MVFRILKRCNPESSLDRPGTKLRNLSTVAHRRVGATSASESAFVRLQFSVCVVCYVSWVFVLEECDIGQVSPALVGSFAIACDVFEKYSIRFASGLIWRCLALEFATARWHGYAYASHRRLHNQGIYDEPERRIRVLELLHEQLSCERLSKLSKGALFFSASCAFLDKVPGYSVAAV